MVKEVRNSQIMNLSPIVSYLDLNLFSPLRKLKLRKNEQNDMHFKLKVNKIWRNHELWNISKAWYRVWKWILHAPMYYFNYIFFALKTYLYEKVLSREIDRKNYLSQNISHRCFCSIKYWKSDLQHNIKHFAKYRHVRVPFGQRGQKSGDRMVGIVDSVYMTKLWCEMIDYFPSLLFIYIKSIHMKFWRKFMLGFQWCMWLLYFSFMLFFWLRRKFLSLSLPLQVETFPYISIRDYRYSI